VNEGIGAITYQEREYRIRSKFAKDEAFGDILRV